MSIHIYQFANLRKLGFEVYYGDATRLDLLHAAWAASAELLVIAMSNTEQAKHLAELAKKHFPRLKIVISAYTREAALEALGGEPYEAYRLQRLFKQKDAHVMPDLYKNRNEQESYISAY
ncbi:NAD-binding protein [Pseudoalteromonas aliena]|uniref:NAD-binding protein n=1 Tax=Pseudoalteromonas aliena TaxID=247523 RepID=UPI00311D3A1E